MSYSAVQSSSIFKITTVTKDHQDHVESHSMTLLPSRRSTALPCMTWKQVRLRSDVLWSSSCI